MKFAALALACALTAGPAVAEDVTAFVHVNLAPMTSEAVLKDQTLIVRDGVVAAIGKDLPPPPGARVIDGGGAAWLAPGLVDGHVHSDTPEALKVYLAHGITSVIDMGAARQEFISQVMPAVNAGKRPGPHVYAALRVDGSPRYGQLVLRDAEDARAAVRLAKANDYSFIKVYNDLAPATFAALAQAGREQGLPLVGHSVSAVGLPAQLPAGQLLVAHLEEFLYTGPGVPPADGPPGDAAIPAVVKLAKDAGAFVGADLVTYGAIADQWGKPGVLAGYLAAPSAAYVEPERRTEWRRSGYVRRTGDITPNLALLGRLALALAQAGVPLVAGTDAPTVAGLVPGVSLHDDLDRLRAAGLTPYQVLASATRTPGELVARARPGEPRFGTLVPGARADLILTARNPLSDLATLRTPRGVMTAGRWYEAGDLKAMLDEVAETYRQSIQ